ncbi:alternative oxidase, mitochondrial-like [Orbicella faveolata]|uniref:alternative oxidase, mitochondrial-like n=1 Tax=Orbicella faveolata TaxID=48498 RepID=UPI0009E3E40F|nr:alternative oxidase, mitochondrial-like [Orbicella faveolata]
MATIGLRRISVSIRGIINCSSFVKHINVTLAESDSFKLRGILLPQRTAISLLSTNAIKREPADEQSTPQVTTQFKEIVIDHFGKDGNTTGNEEYRMPHPVWSEEDVHKVEVTHEKPEKFVDKLAYKSVQALRATFDVISLYRFMELDENRWLNRIIMLETIAGVPGMIGAMTRHFHALRRLTRDNGWIHTLLEEAENERMHLMTALEMKQPGVIFRGTILLAQGVFVNLFFLAYLISPKFCHRFVGYLEEEAVKTYTHCLECIDSGKLPLWKNQLAPKIAVNYWKLPEGSTMRDVILAIRADEAHHRVVNHTLSSLPLCAPNPFLPGEKKL